jgi:hypothetical protein
MITRAAMVQNKPAKKKKKSMTHPLWQLISETLSGPFR